LAAALAELLGVLPELAGVGFAELVLPVLALAELAAGAAASLAPNLLIRKAAPSTINTAITPAIRVANCFRFAAGDFARVVI
ncbi:hypothetical protein LJD48_28230, partial [Escherichia coli]|nr:hypothetical protein [Escherichia coli]